MGSRRGGMGRPVRSLKAGSASAQVGRSDLRRPGATAVAAAVR